MAWKPGYETVPPHILSQQRNPRKQRLIVIGVKCPVHFGTLQHHPTLMVRMLTTHTDYLNEPEIYGPKCPPLPESATAIVCSFRLWNNTKHRHCNSGPLVEILTVVVPSETRLCVAIVRSQMLEYRSSCYSSARGPEFPNLLAPDPTTSRVTWCCKLTDAVGGHMQVCPGLDVHRYTDTLRIARGHAFSRRLVHPDNSGGKAPPLPHTARRHKEEGSKGGACCSQPSIIHAS